MRYTPSAFQAIHEAAEAYLAILFADMNAKAVHEGRVTVMAEDLAWAFRAHRRL